MKIKSYLLSMLLMAAAFCSSGQNLEWGGRFGGSGEDVVRAMHVDSDGNTYTTGYFTDQADFNIGEDEYEIAAVGFYDIFIQKTDANGNFLWAKGIGSDMFDYGTGITTNEQGDVFVTGVFSGETDFDPGLGEMIVNTNGGEDIFLLKLNSLGEFAWVKTFGGDMFDESSSVGVDNEGSVYLSGFYNGTVDFDPGLDEYLLTSEGGNDNFALKIDPLGNLAWAVSYGNEGFEAALSMDVSASGDQFITGFFEGTIDFDPGEGVYELSTEGEFSRGIFMLHLNSDGEFEKAIAVSGESNMTGYDIETDDAGNIYLTGIFYGTVDFDPGEGEVQLTSGGFDDGYVMKLDSNAELVWAKSFESAETIINYEIDVDSEGNVYTTGYHETAADFNPNPQEEFILNESPENAVGTFVAVLNSNGDFVNAIEFGGVNFADFHGIGIDSEDNVIVSGAFENTVDINPNDAATEELTSEGFRDNYIIKYSNITIGVQNIETQLAEIKLYPNPASRMVTIEASKELAGEKYFITDLSGRIVKRGILQSTTQMLIVSELSRGSYIMSFSSGQRLQIVKQ